MSETLNLLVGLAMGLNLLALGSSRLPSLIRAMSLQGVVLGVMPLLIEHERFDWRIVLVALATMAGKGVLIPGLLRRAMRAANIEREIEPFIGFVPSLLLGAGGTIGAVVLARELPLLEPAGSLLVAGSMASILTGFILLIGRVKAISQVCGYLILENGIYLFGLLLIHSTPLLVESGILLDLTVGVFVIGIIVDRIQRAFDSLDTRKLTTLHE
jgi:hydrogenase-4 component E